MSIYDFFVKTKDGASQSMADYSGKVLLIVNTASKCGFTPQYKELQQLYEKYNQSGLEILAFPCNQFANQEPGSDQEIQQFCQINYGVSFPVFAKVDVKGKDMEPLFSFLTEKAPGVLRSSVIKWNFTKFLVNQKGEVIKRYSPSTSPIKIEKDILKLID